MAEILIFGKEDAALRSWEPYAGCGIEEADRIEKAKEILYCNKIKAVLIDLEDNEQEGFVLASYLRQIHRYYLLPLIFLAPDCRYEKTAFHTFHCFDYIIKPAAIENVMRILNLICGQLDPFQIPGGLVLRIRGGVHRIEMSDIVYLEILNRNLIVHTIYDERAFPYRRLGECIDQGRGELVQCHRSIAVNCAYVERLDYAERQVLLKKDMGAVAMGRKYMEDFREKLEKWRRVKYTTNG